MTYNLRTTDINSPDSSWGENFIRRSSEELLSNPKNPAEEAFQSVISTFSDLLKSKLNSIITSKTSCTSFSDSINHLAISLPDFISSLSLIPPYETSEEFESPESFGIPQIVISPTEVKDHPVENLTINILKTSFSEESNQKLIEESSSKSEGEIDDDYGESTTFRRVLQIFRKNGRSIHELYTCIDINRDGKITANEVRAELLRYDSSFTREEAEEVFKILDGDKDGYVSEDDMIKRMKFIIEKAKNEETDPLSCLIVSKPLDPDCIHGNISISLLKVSGFKPGSRCIRFKVKDVLEYLTPEFNENVLTYNFKCDYLIENKTPASLPTTIEVDLLNKNVNEGHASFNWTKSNAITTDFSFKQKLDIKTSLGQARGAIHIQVSWSPIFAKFYSSSDLDRLSRLKQKAETYQAQLERKHKMTRSITHKMTNELPALSEEDSYLEEAKEEVLRSQEGKRMSFLINVCKKSIETLHSPKPGMPRSPSSKASMDFLSIRSVKRNFTTLERPKTPSATKLKVDSPTPSRMLTPTKSMRKNSIQF
jgi:Ca2+-binding EF-hand superfamily protein